MLVLHAHLPYVFQEVPARRLEQFWLLEAIAECYLPLLQVFDRLEAEGIPSPCAVSLSPTLLAMLKDPLLPRAFHDYLAKVRQFCRHELGSPTKGRELARLAEAHAQHCDALEAQFDALEGDLLAGFVRHANSGRLELLTTSATHAVLPLLRNDVDAAARQIEGGLRYFSACTGQARPQGFWLPECAYSPELEGLLLKHGVRYTFLEHQPGQPALCRTPCGLGILRRNAALAEQVWSARKGFPGHPSYREFHRDAGLLPEAAPHNPLRLADGTPAPTGIKLWRVSGQEHKYLYDPQTAEAQARQDARAFWRLAEAQQWGAHEPVLVAPFDAELFGHWWWEGPCFLEALWREENRRQGPVRSAAPGEVMVPHQPLPVLEPAASTWGPGQHFRHWLNPQTEWLFRSLNALGGELSRALETASVSPGQLRAAQVHLLLAQASDWPFMIRAGELAELAQARARLHLEKCQAALQGHSCSADPWQGFRPML